MNNVEFHAGTDERAKNTYPYNFGTDTSKWRWRVDDADTRFDTTNRGLPDKSYSVETHDVDENGASIWNGETNNFFNLMELAFPEEKITGMKSMMTAMQTLGGLKSGNDLDKIYAFYKKYYFSQAQEYFPENAYNADARFCYENGKLAYINGSYSNDTDPITQSLGDHYLAEQRWITKRIIYMMAKYSFGLFSASGTDTITVRAAGNTIKYDLTPAMDLYPAIANGTSIIRGMRTKAGETCGMEIELSGSGDQQNIIQGASYLQDIGDWSGKNVSGSMILQGRMLRDIRLGSKTGTVVISISSLTVSNCVSLQRLLLSNIRTLSGSLNLSACTHLQEVYADGTSLVQIKLPSGGGLRTVGYSSYNQYITLKNYPRMQPMQLLVDIMNAQDGQASHSLKRIRAVGFDETYNSSDMLDKLATLADGTYEGLSSDGLAGDDALPVLDGTLNVHANAYEDSIEALRTTFKKLTLNVWGNFYVRFKDSIAGTYFITTYGDGTGVTSSQLAAIKRIGQIFKGTDIVSFDELEYFTGIDRIDNSAFENCINLHSVKLPASITRIEQYSFKSSGLEKINFPYGLAYIGINAFQNTKLIEVHLPDSVENVIGGTFRDCTNLIEVTANGIKENIFDAFANCTSLVSARINGTYKFIGQDCFNNCISLEYVEISSSVTSLGRNAFRTCKSLKSINIPDAVTEIQPDCFRYCVSMTKLPLSDYIVKIGAYAFAETGLTNPVLPINMTFVEVGSFSYCNNMESIVLQDKIERIGLRAFKSDPQLKEVVIKAILPPILESEVFNNTPNDLRIYVPDESVEAYKTATNWSVHASKIYPLSQKPE